MRSHICSASGGKPPPPYLFVSSSSCYQLVPVMHRAAFLLIIISLIVSSTASGQRHPQKRRVNHPPEITSFSSFPNLVSLCPWNPCGGEMAHLTLVATDADHDSLHYDCTTDVGKLLGGCGPSMTWDLKNVVRGTHKISVKVRDSHGGDAIAQLEITVADCPICDPPPPPCPTITISTPKEATHSRHLLFNVKTEGAESYGAPSFDWTTNLGKIINGQNTSEVEIDASGFVGDELTVTVSVGGFDPSCQTTASKQFVVKN